MTKINSYPKKDWKYSSARTKTEMAFEQGLLAQSINRRALLKRSLYIPLISVLPSCGKKSDTNKGDDSNGSKSIERINNNNLFSSKETLVIQSVQQLLFPNDGDGPDAKAIQAFDYLNFAMTDRQNIEEGDIEYIKNGVEWLTDLSERTKGTEFFNLPTREQELFLARMADTTAGDYFISLLMFYLTESLLTDPIYGGNPDGIGWKWLEHQAGFPRPVAGKTYRDFI